MNTETERRWIPASERKPELGQMVLWAYRYDENDEYEEYTIEILPHGEEVLVDDCFWMPLPQPPEQEGE